MPLRGRPTLEPEEPSLLTIAEKSAKLVMAIDADLIAHGAASYLFVDFRDKETV